MTATLTVVLCGLLIALGLMRVIGVPPINLWFRSRLCPTCKGVGHLRTNDAETVLAVSDELARLHAAGWRVADDGDPYRPDEMPA